MLTTSVVYLTTRKRHDQNAASRQSLQEASEVLNSILHPPTQPEPQTTYIQTRPALLETLKDSWNEQVEGAVRWIQRPNTSRLFDGLEDLASSITARPGGTGSSQA